MRFEKDQILLLHQLIAQESGGSIGVRDDDLLESAINGIYATFDGVELYPSKEEKGARLGYSLIANHAFIDGNKRIGVLVMLTFFEANGIKLNYTDEDIESIGLGVASGNITYDELLQWVYNHESN